MATIQRNVKTYGTRKFVDEVAAAPSNYAPILSNEVDADLDTVYAAWNGGTDSVNLKDGSVTTAKLADAPNGVTNAKIIDKTIDGLTKIKTGSLIRSITTVFCSETAVSGGTAVTFATLNVTLAGGPVFIFGQLLGGVAFNSVGLAWVEVQLKRSGGILRRWLQPIGQQPTTETIPMAFPIFYQEPTAPGAVPYTLEVMTDTKCAFRADAFVGNNRAGSLWAIELV